MQIASLERADNRNKVRIARYLPNAGSEPCVSDAAFFIGSTGSFQDLYLCAPQ